MKWAVREANRRYVEQTLQEDEPGDVYHHRQHHYQLLYLFLS